MHDQRLERLTFFSDAVFAIAMTLLVIELRVPEVHQPSDRAFLLALAYMIPSFIGFLTSFLVIGVFWVSHHRGFALVAHYRPELSWANLFLLLAIVSLPFSSALMSDYYGQRVPHLVYLATLLAAGLLQRRLMGLAMAEPQLAADADRARVAGLLRRMWAVPLVASLALIAAIWVPAYSTLLLALIPVAIRVLERAGRGAVATTA